MEVGDMVACFNNKVENDEIENFEIGELYEIEFINESAVLIAGFSFSLSETIKTRYEPGINEGGFYQKPTIWFWGLYFKVDE